MKVRSTVKSTNLHNWLSLSLKVGVFLAFVLITIGLIILCTTKNAGADLIVPLNELVGNITNFDAVMVISLGIAILLFTPIIQIIIAVVKFAFDHDKLYLGICLVLLFVLATSLVFSLV
jgi:uncharacterized membrane protein